MPIDFRVSKVLRIVHGGHQVRNEVVQRRLSVNGGVALIGAEPVSAQELEAAKNFRNGQFAIGLETPEALAAQFVSLKINGLPNEYLPATLHAFVMLRRNRSRRCVQSI